MSREKQIEEMAKIVAVQRGYGCNERDHCDMSCQVCKCGCIPHEDAEILYEAGYRKQSEGEWITDEEGYVTCSNCGEEHTWDEFRPPYCDMCGAKMKGGAE